MYIIYYIYEKKNNMVYLGITNSPELSKACANEDVQRLIYDILLQLEDAYTLKQFLIEGTDKTYNDIIDQLSVSFEVIERKGKDDGFLSVKRCIDGKIFKVGDKVDAKIYNGQLLRINRLYEDDRGLHVGLGDDGGDWVTWRKLSDICHRQDKWGQSLPNTL